MVSIPTIMSTTSSCQLPIMNQAVGIRKRVNSRVKTLSAAKPSVFSGESGLRGRRSRVSVSAGAGLDLGKPSTKSALDCSKSSTCTSKC